MSQWVSGESIGLAGIAFKIVLVIALAAMLADCASSIGADASAVVAHEPKPRPSRLVVGNYCGYGRRFGDLSAPAVDRLDTICKSHDVCYISGRDRCACNAELLTALDAYLADGVPDEGARRRARLVGFTIRAMTPYCHVFPHGLFPRRQDHLLGTLRD